MGDHIATQKSKIPHSYPFILFLPKPHVSLPKPHVSVSQSHLSKSHFTDTIQTGSGTVSNMCVRGGGILIPTSNSQDTPKCPMIQLNSEIIYLEIALDSIGQWLNPTRLPPATLGANFKPRLLSVLLINWLYNRGFQDLLLWFDY